MAVMIAACRTLTAARPLALASRVSWFSSRGTKVVDVVALGENVYSDSIGGYELSIQYVTA